MNAVNRTFGVLLATLLLTPSAALAAQKGQYLPPMAPQLDPSVFPAAQPKASSSGYSSSPAPAPSRQAYSGGGSGGSDANYSAGNDDQVKELLRQALAKHNDGDMAGAAAAFKQVLSIDPKNADANFNLGAMYEDKGDLNAALKYYQAAAKVNPNDSDVRDAIASVQAKVRQQATAQQMAQKSELKQIAQDAAAAYKAGNYDQAINDLQQVLKQTPNDANAMFALAQAYRGKGNRAQARQLLAHAAATDPNNALYRQTLAEVDREQQQNPSSPQVAQNDGGPAAAPDYSRRRGGRGGAGNGYGGAPSYGGANDDSQGLQPYDDGGSPQVANNGAPEGQITPFTDQGQGELYGHAGVGNMGMGGMGPGMAMGMGGIGSLLGMGMLNGGINRGAYYGGRGTRLVRNAAMGSLAGAAVGGLMNMHGAGGFKGGAMRGALTGGIMGLITGF